MDIKTEDLKIDYQATFGTLKFIGFKKNTELYEYDEEEQRNISTGEITDKRYEVSSSAQEDFFDVVVPPNVDVAFSMGTEVDLIEPHFENYMLRGNEPYIKVFAQNIVKKQGGPAEPVKKEDPKPVTKESK